MAPSIPSLFPVGVVVVAALVLDSCGPPDSSTTNRDKWVAVGVGPCTCTASVRGTWCAVVAADVPSLLQRHWRPR